MGDIRTYSLDMLLSAAGYPKILTATSYTRGFFAKDPACFTNQELPAEYAGKLVWRTSRWALSGWRETLSWTSGFTELCTWTPAVIP